MGAYNVDSWAEKPDLVIQVKDTSEQLKRCSMNRHLAALTNASLSRIAQTCWNSMLIGTQLTTQRR